ncbi:hypothetical protein GYB62_00380 [bacterium]|nr:hypothetical protein [bacterium]
MNTREPDELTSLPNMRAERDDVVSRSPAGRSAEQVASKPAKGGGGLLAFLALLCALAAGAAAYWLWQQQQQAVEQLLDAQQRIAVLESQLASTGDEMSQSDAAVRVRLKELDSEVRKLWDNVWKKAKDTLAAHDTSLKQLTQQSSALKSQQASHAAQLTANAALLDELETTSATLTKQRQQVQQMADQLKQLDGDLRRLNARVADNEEWIESINAFRQQVNQRLSAPSAPTP